MDHCFRAVPAECCDFMSRCVNVVKKQQLVIKGKNQWTEFFPCRMKLRVRGQVACRAYMPYSKKQPREVQGSPVLMEEVSQTAGLEEALSK